MYKWINEYMNKWINEKIKKMNKWKIELPLFYLWFCPRNPSPLYFYKHFTSILNKILHIKKNECVMEDQTVVAHDGRTTKKLIYGMKEKNVGAHGRLHSPLIWPESSVWPNYVVRLAFQPSFVETLSRYPLHLFFQV